MTAQDRHRIAVPCLAAGICFVCAAGCTRNSLRPPDGTAQAELEQALAARGPSSPASAPEGEPNGPPPTTGIAENLLRGHREAEAGRLDQAARFYERVLREDPRHPVAHHRLAVIADQNRDFAAAERHYSAALETRPNDPDVLNDLGYCYLLQGRYPESERTLRDAVAIAPTHERALTNLGMLYGKIGDLDRALAVLRLTGSDEEARAKLAIVVPPSASRADGQPALAPPLRPSTAGAVLQTVAVVPSRDEPDYAGAGAAPNTVTQDLIDQLARAKQEAYAGRATRPAPGRLPGLIDPAEMPVAPQPMVVQPYTRSPREVYLAARPAVDGAARPTNHRLYGNQGAIDSETTVMARPGLSPGEHAGDLPLWSPPPGAVPPPSQPASLSDPRAPRAGLATRELDGPPESADAGFGPRLPAAVYSSPGDRTGYGLPSPYGYGSPPLSAAQDIAAGHSPAAPYAEAGLRAYAEDLARRDAEAAELHRYLQADVRSQAGFEQPTQGNHHR